MTSDKPFDVEFYFPGMKINRFTIKKGDAIPLHSHPEQFGIFFVLQGKCGIKKYQIISKEKTSYTIKLIEDSILMENDYSIITPTINIHTLIAHEDTRMIDIFNPGVVTGRISEYLKIISSEQNGNFIVEPVDIAVAGIPEYLKDGHDKTIKVNDDTK